MMRGISKAPRRAAATAGVLGAVLLAACARLPVQSPAATPVQATVQAPAADAAALTPGAWPQEAWWERFADTDLNRLMARALSRNPDLGAAQARVAAARAAVQAARVALLPRISAGAALTQQHFSATGEHSALNGRSVLYGDLEPLSIVYDVDISGEHTHRLAAAAGVARAAAAGQAAARLTVTTALADAWFAAAGYNGALTAERRQLALMRHLLTLRRLRLTTGLDDGTGVPAVRQAVARLRLQIATDRAERDSWLAAAADLAGESPGATAALRPAPPVLGRFTVPRDLPVGLLRHRPDVMAALWEVEAARQGVKAARAAFYPHLNLALFAGWNSIHLSDLFDPANFAHSIGPALTLPLFEGGALRANLAGARSGYDLAVQHYNARVLGAVKEVAAGLAQWRGDREAMLQSRTAAGAARERARVRAVALRAGLSSGLPSLDADVEAAAQAAQAARAAAAAARSWVRLAAALGGGYVAEQPPPPPVAGRSGARGAGGTH